MKVLIKVVTAGKEFTADQKNVMRRYVNVLQKHNLSVSIILKQKVTKSKQLKLKAV